MKKYSTALLLSLSLSLTLFTMNGCMKTIQDGAETALSGIGKGLSSGIGSLRNSFANIKPNDSIVLLAHTTIDTRKMEAKGEIFFQNLDTKQEYSINLRGWKVYPILKVVPGKYKIIKWSFSSCSEVIRYKDGTTSGCTGWRNFSGVVGPLIQNIFTIKKGETIYLGHAILDSKKRTLTIKNDAQSDIKIYMKMYDALQTRKITNISNTINVKNWYFKITGIKFFGL